MRRGKQITHSNEGTNPWPLSRFLACTNSRLTLPMTKPLLRLLLLTATVATVALAGGAARANACGNSSGYSYAGLASPNNAYGISALISPLDAFDILNGHVAGWVGVGGPGQGPGGSNEWLQIGLSGFPGIDGSDIYYEVALPGRYPTYHQVAANLPVGTVAKVTVLEMHNRPDWWRVWLNHRAVSPAIHLPQSHSRWSPIATAESWTSAGAPSCNGFAYRFDDIKVAQQAGGSWRALSNALQIRTGINKLVLQRSPASFEAIAGKLVHPITLLSSTKHHAKPSLVAGTMKRSLTASAHATPSRADVRATH